MRQRAILATLTALLLLISTGQVAGSPPEDKTTQAGRYDAQESQAGYSLPWWTVDGGVGSSGNATSYSLMGTAGQPDTGVWESSGYTLSGGFCGGVPTAERHVYLPLVVHDF
jgi:hypothetical protein